MSNFEGGRRHPSQLLTSVPGPPGIVLHRLESMLGPNRFAISRPFHPYEPEGEPLPRAEARAIAAAGLIALNELLAFNESQREMRQKGAEATLTRELDELLLRDHSLQPVHRLKFEGPFRIIGRCGHRFGYAAMTPFPEQQGVIILTAPYVAAKSKRRGGARDLLNADRTKAVVGTQNMVEDAMEATGRTTVIPSGAGDWGDTSGRRRELICPLAKCQAQERILHGRLLKLFLEAIVDDGSEITLLGTPLG